jgi:hypothetical protein
MSASVVITGPTPTASLGAVQGQVGVATGNFTITPNTAINCTVSFSDLSITDQTIGGGTFTPTSLTFSNSAVPQTFTYTPGKVGNQLMKVAFSDTTITKSADLWVVTTH